ncbi:MAG: ATP-dependent RNA helicase dbp4 [Watsoniomyces obsoletus]|nr:MAG: ATP-dependent RNA helicase dbp4 [Watsoniomyces obsoletus]
MPQAETLAEDLFDQSTLDESPDEPSSTEDASVKHLCADIYARISAFLQDDFPDNERLRDVQLQTRRSLKVIEEALNRYTLDELSLSYNGGKDCLVLLILYLCALHNHPHTNFALRGSLQSVYIVPTHPFEEVDTFVRHTTSIYHLDLARYPAPMRSAFEAYLRDRPLVKAVLVGTRRTDPHGAGLTHFDPTDGGWPEFMRVHPVIDWHYAEIWAFLLHLRIPYCPLYNAGYTSLGGTTDTHPNPALRIPDSELDDEDDGVDEGNVKKTSDVQKDTEDRGVEDKEEFKHRDGDREENESKRKRTKRKARYRPAYELLDDLEERLGRE